MPSDALYLRKEEAWKREHLSQNLPISTTEKFRAAQSNYWLARYNLLSIINLPQLLCDFMRVLKAQREIIRSCVLKILITHFSSHVRVNRNNMMYNLWNPKIDSNTWRTVCVIPYSENFSIAVVRQRLNKCSLDNIYQV